jgi:hypothetical protein
MNRLMLAGSVAAAIGMAGAQGAAAQEPMVSAVDPQAVRALFESWGYRPTALEGLADQPLFQATVSGLENVVVFGGCRAGRDCTHIVLIATYNDVLNPPHESRRRDAPRGRPANLAHRHHARQRRSAGLGDAGGARRLDRRQ